MTFTVSIYVPGSTTTVSAVMAVNTPFPIVWNGSATVPSPVASLPLVLTKNILETVKLLLVPVSSVVGFVAVIVKMPPLEMVTL